MEEKKLDLNLDQRPKESIVYLYDPDGNFIEEISSAIDFVWVRLQIAKDNLKGYYFTFEGKRYDINPNGSLSEWPGGLFTQFVSMTSKLLAYKMTDDVREKSRIPLSEQIDINNCPKNLHVDVFDNEDKLICHTNDDLQFIWVRAQIKKKGLRGCYVMFGDEKIPINERGDLKSYPHGLFEHYSDQLIALV